VRGGRKIERPVREFSLNWHPSERPDQEEMLRAVQSFLKHMGWEEHQAVVIAHSDKPYRHAHVILNAVHPETGLKLDDGFEKRRAQVWALEYEREHGKIFCEERLKPAAAREQSEPRPAWMAIKEHSERAGTAERESAPFDPSYLGREESRRLIEHREWQILKEVQREERLAFRDGGKDVYRDLNRAIYREVREEFRSEWASYYAAKREGLHEPALARIKVDLTARQSDLMQERFTAAAAEKRAERDLEYRALLDEQKDQRAELIGRQELGLRSPHLLDRLYPQSGEGGTVGTETGSEEEALGRFGIRRGRSEEPAAETPRERTPISEEPLLMPPLGNTERSPKRDIGAGLAGGVLGALGHLGDSLMGGHTKPPKKQPEPLSRFGVQRGQPPPGDRLERAARSERQAHEDRRDWKEWHHFAERER
jgi:hypothetical protein